MHENENNHLNNLDDAVDLQEFFNILWAGKWIIISVSAFFSIFGVIYSLLLPNIYESKAILVPTNQSSISSSLQQYAGLAGLAGVSLPSSDDGNNSIQAQAKLNSLSFFEKSILPNIFLPDLMALKNWDNRTNTLVYDETIYNKELNVWTRDFSYPYKQIPSAQESFEVFKTKHLSLSEDIKTGFITIAIKHQSPYLAKQLIELHINQINNFYREKDKSESEKALGFLNKQISMTSLSEVKEVISKLMQEETKKLALVEANEFYVFEFIDPPVVMEKKSEPKRAIICILSMLLGGMLGSLYVIIRYYAFREKLY